jgi:hypothetical protein
VSAVTKKKFKLEFERAKNGWILYGWSDFDYEPTVYPDDHGFRNAVMREIDAAIEEVKKK